MGAQLEQLGPEWMDKILVTKHHPVRKLIIIRTCRREMDTDNCYGGSKVIIDALKSKPDSAARIYRIPGWFYDDSTKFLDLVIKQVKGGEPGSKPFLNLYLWEKCDGSSALA